LTTNEGQLDPENINARLNFLVESPSRQWMSDTVLSSIETAFEHDGLVPEGTGTTIEPSVAVRGVIVGLVHSVGSPNPDALRADAHLAARLTHDDAASAASAEYVAQVTSEAARHVDAEPTWTIPAPEFAGEIADRLVTIKDTVRTARTFEDAVLAVVRMGGDTTAYGAIAGGIAGARFGAAGLPQSLIDDLDARIYLSMAAPWFYRTARKRAGFAIDLRLIENEFPG
jgi:ADP-ribosylglycohydrolase